MKGFKVGALVVCMLLFASSLFASGTYTKSTLTGGTSGALDGIDGSLLSDGDRAMVINSTGSYFYWLDADSGEAENSPYVVTPDSNASDKRWIYTAPYTRLVEDIAALRGISGDSGENTRVQLLGYYAALDGGGGPQRVWVDGASVGTYVDNGGSVIVPTGGDGSAAWLWQAESDIHNVLWWGIVNDASIDAATRMAVMEANVDTWLIPEGVYLNSGTSYTVDADTVITNRDFFTAINPFMSAENNCVLYAVDTPTSATDSQNARVPVSVSVTANGGNHATGIRSNLFNKSTNSAGCTGMYAKAVGDTSSVWSAALHGETRHGGGTSIAASAEVATYATSGAPYGLVVNYTNAGAESTHPITGASKVVHPDACAVAISGTASVADWDKGLWIKSGSVQSDGYAIFDESNAYYGLVLNGSYGSNTALRIAADTAIAYEATNIIRSYYDSSDYKIKFYNDTSERAAINMQTGAMEVNGTKVIGPQETGWSLPTGTSDRTAFSTSTVTLEELAQRVRALILDLHATTGHGLLGG